MRVNRRGDDSLLLLADKRHGDLILTRLHPELVLLGEAAVPELLVTVAEDELAALADTALGLHGHEDLLA